MAETNKHKSDGVKEAAKPARRSGSFEQKPETLLEQPDVLALQRAMADPQRAAPAEVRALQVIAGNRAVQRLLVQRQLPEEEEEILQAKALQRQPMEEEELLQAKALQRQSVEEEEELMMKPLPRVGLEGGPVPEDVASGIQRARTGGRPLERGVREQMSAAMGFDFSGVRVHTGAQADTLNQQLSARAFTTGRDIFFRRGEYAPGSGSGRALLAHELTHVVQQSTGQVRGCGHGMRVRPAGDAFEQEASLAARRSKSTLQANFLLLRLQSAEDTALQRALANHITPAALANEHGIVEIDNNKVKLRGTNMLLLCTPAVALAKAGDQGQSVNDVGDLLDLATQVRNDAEGKKGKPLAKKGKRPPNKVVHWVEEGAHKHSAVVTSTGMAAGYNQTGYVTGGMTGGQFNEGTINFPEDVKVKLTD